MSRQSQIQEAIFMARGIIASLPDEDRVKCEALIDKLRKEIAAADPAIAALAYSLVGLELENSLESKD